MLKKESAIYNSLEVLIDNIKQSDTYKECSEASEAVRSQPGLLEEIDEFRKKNFWIQQNYEGDDLLREMEKFAAESAAFRSQPLVDRFLSAELSFIRLKQEIDNHMLSRLEFLYPKGE